VRLRSSAAIALAALTAAGAGSAESAGDARSLITSASMVGPASSQAWSARCASAVRAKRRVFVSDGRSLPRLAATRPAGTTFCIRSGVHRLAARIVPRSGQAFVGERGAVLSGARDISSRFVRAGRYWSASLGERNPVLSGRCLDGGVSCKYANDVFFDDGPLRRVETVEALNPSTFVFDQSTGKVWLARSPHGHRVEAAVTTRAIAGWGSGAVNVLVSGLVIEKFANEGQAGALQGGAGWAIESNEVRLNHGVGVQGGHVIRRNHLHHNGQLGYSTHGATGTVFVENEVAYNNYAGYDWHWEAGGAKFMVTTRLTVRGNYVHHNRATGLATDWDNVHTLYESNRVEDNLGVGIFHEASYDAVIRNNIVRRNGSATRGGFDGAGIGLNASANVEIVGNTVVGNLHGVGIVAADREPGKYGAHVTRNVFVHDNTISLDERISSTGLTSSDAADYTTNNNRFEANRYTYCQPTPFAWRDPDGTGYAFLTKEAWVAFGNDTAGSFRIRAGC
jgi:parallel beta-helix repeat protein